MAAKTNEEDKTLIAEKAALTTTQTNLEKELAEINEEVTEITERIQFLSQPLGPDGESLDEILKKVEVYDQAASAKTRAELDLENKTKERVSAETNKTRSTEVLMELPGGSLENEETASELAEELQSELKARQKHELEASLLTATVTTRKREKELAEIPEADSEKTLRLERNAAAVEHAHGNLLTAQSQCSKIPDDQKTEDHKEQLETESMQLNLKKGKLNQAIETITQTHKDLVAAANTFKHLLPNSELAATDPEKAKSLLLAEFQKQLEFGTGPIGHAEATTLSLRLLQHWTSHPHEECPLCSSDLKDHPLFSNEKSRAGMITGLLAEQESPEDVAKKRNELTRALGKVEEVISKKEALIALDAYPHWETAAQTRKDQIAEMDERIKTIAQTITALESLLKSQADVNKGVANLLNDLPPTNVGKSPLELVTLARNLANELRETQTKKQVLATQIEASCQEVTRITNQIAALGEAQEPSEKHAAKSEEDLKTALAKTQAELKTLRETRAARSKAEKELEAAKTKLLTALEAEEASQKAYAKITEVLDAGAGMPLPAGSPEGTTFASATEIWKDYQHERSGLIARNGPLLARKAIRKDEQKANAEALAVLEQKVARAQAARALIAFLDYKNAPRKLLASICEKLFESTNKMGEKLQAGIRLKLGKDLDFLTLQHRGGRLIQQKTERLGFGKGAILGICFRLATQKLLLPDTGFLILDEPSANVDTKRKNALKTFLQNLGEETESKTRQIILIEHDLDVIELCQAKIHIGENN